MCKLDGEADWQDRISSGFDRLVAFASTELDKRRRSTEGVNTSPDSGLGSDTSAAVGTQRVAPSPDDTLGPPRTPSPTSPHPLSNASGAASNNGNSGNMLPLKYQRHMPDSERHHFKKKFFHREWNSPAGGGGGGGPPPPNNNNNNNNASSTATKFRPKGKDWDWNSSNQWPPGGNEQS